MSDQPQTQDTNQEQPQTVAVRYVGEEPFIYGDQRIEKGGTVELPAEEVQAWGADVPAAFEKE